MLKALNDFLNRNYPNNGQRRIRRVAIDLVSTTSQDPSLSIGTLQVADVHIPEPTSTLSLLAFGTFGAVSTLSRRLKPKPAKETTKVS